jgi:hypothetical protein
MTRQLAPAKGAADPDPCNADTNPLGIELQGLNPGQRLHQWRGSFLRRLPFRPANPQIHARGAASAAFACHVRGFPA